MRTIRKLPLLVLILLLPSALAQNEEQIERWAKEAKRGVAEGELPTWVSPKDVIQEVLCVLCAQYKATGTERTPGYIYTCARNSCHRYARSKSRDQGARKEIALAPHSPDYPTKTELSDLFEAYSQWFAKLRPIECAIWTLSTAGVGRAPIAEYLTEREGVTVGENEVRRITQSVKRSFLRFIHTNHLDPCDLRDVMFRVHEGSTLWVALATHEVASCDSNAITTLREAIIGIVPPRIGVKTVLGDSSTGKAGVYSASRTEDRPELNVTNLNGYLDEPARLDRYLWGASRTIERAERLRILFPILLNYIFALNLDVKDYQRALAPVRSCIDATIAIQESDAALYSGIAESLVPRLSERLTHLLLQSFQNVEESSQADCVKSLRFLAEVAMRLEKADPGLIMSIARNGLMPGVLSESCLRRLRVCAQEQPILTELVVSVVRACRFTPEEMTTQSALRNLLAMYFFCTEALENRVAGSKEAEITRTKKAIEDFILELIKADECGRLRNSPWWIYNCLPILTGSAEGRALAMRLTRSASEVDLLSLTRASEYSSQMQLGYSRVLFQDASLLGELPKERECVESYSRRMLEIYNSSVRAINQRMPSILGRR